MNTMVVFVVVSKSTRMCSLLLLEEDREATVWTVPKLIIYNISLIESPLYKKKEKREIQRFRILEKRLFWAYFE